jgi:hypothetical protein
VIEEISPGRRPAPTPRAPDLIEPIVAFRGWRVVDGRLRSVYLPTYWAQRQMTADCLCAESPDADAQRTAATGHGVPDRGCTCGIYAYYEPDLNFPKVDHQGVAGIVSLWGAIEVHDEGMRAEHARIEALALYSRWTNRQLDAVRAVAEDLGVDLVDLDEIEAAARRYGQPIAPDLVPGTSTLLPSGSHTNAP